MPIVVGVGKRGVHLLVHGDLPRQHSFGTTLRFTDPVPAIPVTKYTGQKKINEGHSIERVWHSAGREPSDTLPGSQPCTQKTRSIYHIPYSKGFSFTNGTIDVA